MGFFSELKSDLSAAVDSTDEADKEEELEIEKTLGKSMPTHEDEEESFDEPTIGTMTKEPIIEETDASEQETQEPVEEPEAKETSQLQDVLSSLESIDLNLNNNAETPEMPKAEENISNNGGYTMEQDHSLSDEVSTVTEGMTIRGDIDSNGSMDLIGTVIGNINLKGKLNVSGEITGDSSSSEFFADSAKITGDIHSDGSVKIGQNSVIIGNIMANTAVIAGAVKGDIDVHGPVILDTTAIVMGNIKSQSVQINNGAVIEGMCSQSYADVNPSAFFDGMK